MMYFAKDGNYGSSAGMVVLDASGFTDQDWEDIEEAADWDRPSVASRIYRSI